MPTRPQRKKVMRRNRVHPRYLRIGGYRVMTAPRMARIAAGLSLWDVFLRADRRYSLKTLEQYDLNGCDNELTAEELSPAFAAPKIAFLFPRDLDRKATTLS